MYNTRGQPWLLYMNNLTSLVKDVSFDTLLKFALKPMRHTCKTQQERKTAVQLRSAWLSGSVCHLDMSSAECSTGLVENLCIWTRKSVHSCPNPTLFKTTWLYAIHVYSIYVRSSFPRLLEMGRLHPDISVNLMSGCLTVCEAYIKGMLL